MVKKYTRKRIGNLDDLDREQEKIRNRSKAIENDFLDMLKPQQLAINFIGNLIQRKIKGGKKTKGDTGSSIQSFSGSKLSGKSSYKDKLHGVVTHPLFKGLLKKAGVSFLKWQTFNLALFVGSKIYKAIREKKHRYNNKRALVQVFSRK